MPRVSREHIAKRRKAILQAARDAFIRKGYNNATIKDVADGMKALSRGGIYAYYSTTEEMMRDILNNEMGSVTDYLALLTGGHQTVWDALTAYVDNVRENFHDLFAMVTTEYFLDSCRDEDRKAFMHQRYSKAIELYTSLLQEGIDRGEFTPLQPVKVISNVIANMMDGIILGAVLVGKEETEAFGQIEALKFYLKKVLQVKEKTERAIRGS